MKSSIIRLLLTPTILLGLCPLAVHAQVPLTWANGVQNNVGGIDVTTTQRPTVSSAVFNQRLYVVYQSIQSCVTNACALEMTSTSEQLSNGSFNFSQSSTISVPGIGTVLTASNPSLAVNGGYAYLTWTDPNGNNYVSESQNMTTWSSPLSIPATPTVTSMDMVIQPNTGDLWIAYMKGAASSGSYSPIICSVTPDNGDFPNSTTSCNTVTYMSQVNFNPSLTWGPNNNLYAFMAYRGNSHCLNSYANNYGGDLGDWFYYNPSSLCHDNQTSSAPSSSFYFNGYLYVAYRSNDSSQKFDYTRINTSPNPNTWVSYSLNDQMDGGPDLIELSASRDGISLLQPQELVNFFVRTGYLYSTYGY